MQNTNTPPLLSNPKIAQQALGQSRNYSRPNNAQHDPQYHKENHYLLI
jgi:hypothetical protein